MTTELSMDVLASVDLAGVIAYLRAAGWQEAGSYSRAVVWTRRFGDGVAEVLVPDSAELRDYASRIADVVDTLSYVEQRQHAEILQDLRSPMVDVQYIRMMPDGPSGTTPLHEGYLAVKGVRDLFLAVATSAVSTERPTVLPSQKPPQAHGFLDQVRLGQTSRGSYVLRVETPLHPPGETPQVSTREVLLHLFQAASAAHDAAHGDRSDFAEFGERVGDGVSANLCDALAEIGGRRRSPFELRFAWAPTAPVEVPTPVIHFDRDSITALKGAGKYLRELPVAEEAIVVGRVVDLHRTPMDKLGKVEVEGVVDERGRRHEDKVTMRLPPRYYELALTAHRDQRPIQVSGSIRHTGRRFEISQVVSVEIPD